MDQAWREHLEDEGDGTMRIRAHGNMKVDARLITDAAHMKQHADDRGPEQLVNTASLPGVVGEAWAMADWHYGYGFPIGGVVQPTRNTVMQVVPFPPVALALTSIVVSDSWPLMRRPKTFPTSRN